jgi:hypothetical protein
MACFFCSPSNKKEYSKAQQAISVSKSIADSAIAWVRGKPVFTDMEMQIRRLKVCQSCNYRQLKGKNLHCGICGCDIPLKSKIVETQCPDGRW